MYICSTYRFNLEVNTAKLKIKQLDQILGKYVEARDVEVPSTGWIRAIRTSLGMSLLQLSRKMGTSLQNVRELERREAEKAITLRSLNDVAEAMDMKLIYALVPKDGSLEDLIEKKAKKLAREIVQRASQNMVLEDQRNDDARLQEAVKERMQEIIYEMPKTLWD